MVIAPVIECLHRKGTFIINCLQNKGKWQNEGAARYYLAMAKQDDYIKTALRLPTALHTRIQLAAEKAGRSMNAEIISRVEQSFSDEPLHAQTLKLLDQQVALMTRTHEFLSRAAVQDTGQQAIIKMLASSAQGALEKSGSSDESEQSVAFREFVSALANDNDEDAKTAFAKLSEASGWAK